MRIPIETYLESVNGKVYSLVVSVPFTPIDIDLSLLARGEWNASCDRFRIWYLPKIEGQNAKPISYVMVRKFDPEQGILIFAHVNMNLEAIVTKGEPGQNFTVAILSNDEVKAHSILGAMLGIPPSFHKRSEISMVERKWRSDPETVARFASNVYGAVSNLVPGDKIYKLKVEAPPDFMAAINPGIDKWWADEEPVDKEKSA